ncbi:hypothetical protein NQ176_g4577 [Zarea fungicola]|uniref:Uncharacterized protein n=1 Tax=Zarea fungicola TaxID=93591 RepID=A0ACC1NDH8_9HYPO|nr:hypothetical protein NQ176_g4577 [Lecanicillium fungicola]
MSSEDMRFTAFECFSEQDGDFLSARMLQPTPTMQFSRRCTDNGRHGVIEIFETYGRALRHLRKDFETAGKWTSAQTFVALWACEFLALYELINPTSPCNWMDHGRGMGLLVLGYIVQRKRCFLEQRRWWTVPWQGISSRRTFLSRVTDFLCEVPGLMEDVDILLLRRSQGLDVEVIAENLEDKLRDRVLRLANLLNRWDLEHPFVCREVPLPPGSATSFGMDDKLLFETILWYDNIEFCRTMVGFNAVILLLYSMCDAVGLSEISVAGAGSPDDNHQYTNPIVVPLQGTKAAHALEYSLLGGDLIETVLSEKAARRDIVAQEEWKTSKFVHFVAAVMAMTFIIRLPALGKRELKYQTAAMPGKAYQVDRRNALLTTNMNSPGILPSMPLEMRVFGL